MESGPDMNTFARTISLLLLCLTLTSLSWAEGNRVEELVTPEMVEANKVYEGVIKLNGPAPYGGVKVMFLPAHHLALPDEIWVEEGQSEAKFEFEVYGKKLDRTLFRSNIKITTVVKGKIKEWNGPKLAHQH